MKPDYYDYYYYFEYYYYYYYYLYHYYYCYYMYYYRPRPEVYYCNPQPSDRPKRSWRGVEVFLVQPQHSRIMIAISVSLGRVHSGSCLTSAWF